MQFTLAEKSLLARERETERDEFKFSGSIRLLGDGYGDARPGRSSTAVSLSCALFTSRTFHQGAKAVTVKLPQPWAPTLPVPPAPALSFV